MMFWCVKTGTDQALPQNGSLTLHLHNSDNSDMSYFKTLMTEYRRNVIVTLIVWQTMYTTCIYYVEMLIMQWYKKL